MNLELELLELLGAKDLEYDEHDDQEDDDAKEDHKDNEPAPEATNG